MSSRRFRRFAACGAAAAMVAVGLPALAAQASAAGYPRSQRVAMVPDAGGRNNNGGTLPTAAFPDSYAPQFTNVTIESIRDDATDPLVVGEFDTVVLNTVCDVATFLGNPQFKSRLESFVTSGGKLIIWDSECTATDYTKFAIPFTTSNPGAAGAHGTLVDVEANTLSSSDPASAQYVNVAAVSTGTDAVGDANVFTTYDPRWFVDLRATNSLGVNGPVQAYAKLGSGLVIYSGLDKDSMSGGTFDPAATDGVSALNRIWLLELLQPWNPDGLPASTPAAGGKNLNYVALGDSYSAGEGAGSGKFFQNTVYTCSTGRGRNAWVQTGLKSPKQGPGWTCVPVRVDIPCHRAPTAWSFTVAKMSGDINDDVQNAACTGATVYANLLDNWLHGEQPQSKRLADLNKKKPVDLVTFTIGGNDIDFPGIVAACWRPRIPFVLDTMHRSYVVYTPGCENAYKTVAKKLSQVGKDFDTAIAALHTAAKGATLAFVSYPQVVPDNYADVTGCSWFAKDEDASMRKVVGEVNMAQFEAVQRAKARDPKIKIEFIDITDALKGHEICTASSHVVPVRPISGGNPWDSNQAHPDSVDRDGNPNNGVQGSGQDDLAKAVFAGLKAKGLISG